MFLLSKTETSSVLDGALLFAAHCVQYTSSKHALDAELTCTTEEGDFIQELLQFALLCTTILSEWLTLSSLFRQVSLEKAELKQPKVIE